MRIRHKPHARPTLLGCPYFVDDPGAKRGRWPDEYDAARPLHLDLGCGKGVFIAEASTRRPDVNFLGVDLKDEILLAAHEAVEAARRSAGHVGDNLRITPYDIERIGDILGEADAVVRIHISFPNPWPKKRHHKHRLTHTRQLLHYRDFLAPGGEVWFKTDDDALFADSLRYFEEAGYRVAYLSRDLGGSGFAGDIPTEHQCMFERRGIPIKFCIAAK